MNTPNTPHDNGDDCVAITDKAGIALFRLIAICGVLKMDAKGIKMRHTAAARKAAVEELNRAGIKCKARTKSILLVTSLNHLIAQRQAQRAAAMNGGTDATLNEPRASYGDDPEALVFAVLAALDQFASECRKSKDADRSKLAVGEWLADSDLDEQSDAVASLLSLAADILEQGGGSKLDDVRANIKQGYNLTAACESLVGTDEMLAASQVRALRDRLIATRVNTYETLNGFIEDTVVEEEAETWGGKECRKASDDLAVVEQGLMLNDPMDADRVALRRARVLLDVFGRDEVMAGIWSALNRAGDGDWEWMKSIGLRALMDKPEIDHDLAKALAYVREQGVDKLVDEFKHLHYDRHDIEAWEDAIEIFIAEEAATQGMRDIFDLIRRGYFQDGDRQVEEPRSGYGSDPRRGFDEAVYWMPYERGEEAGLSSFDPQYYWGGRVTKREDAVAAARAVVKADKDGEGIDAFGGRIEPRADWLEVEVADAIADLSKAFPDEMGKADTYEIEERVTERWNDGFAAGYWEACVDSARDFLRGEGIEWEAVEEGRPVYGYRNPPTADDVVRVLGMLTHGINRRTAAKGLELCEEAVGLMDGPDERLAVLRDLALTLSKMATAVCLDIEGVAVSEDKEADKCEGTPHGKMMKSQANHSWGQHRAASWMADEAKRIADEFGEIVAENDKDHAVEEPRAVYLVTCTANATVTSKVEIDVAGYLDSDAAAKSAGLTHSHRVLALVAFAKDLGLDLWIDEPVIDVEEGRVEEPGPYAYCDNCAELLSLRDMYRIAKLANPVESANAGESAVLCAGCCVRTGNSHDYGNLPLDGQVEEARELYHVSPSSGNVKTGPIPVTTTSSITCPKACPFRTGGCYAKHGNLGMFWRNLDAGKVSTAHDWDGFLSKLRGVLQSCQPGQIWRHNQAGDLPGIGDEIDAQRLGQLIGVAVTTGTRGFTYTHKPMLSGAHAEANRQAIGLLTGSEFVVNLSANNLEQADRLAALGIAPVVVTLPRGSKGCRTPAGRVVKVCPAQVEDGVTCARCQMCAKSDRKVIVGFLAHGSGAAKVERVAK